MAFTITDVTAGTAVNATKFNMITPEYVASTEAATTVSDGGVSTDVGGDQTLSFNVTNTCTLPTASANTNRILTVVNTGSGAVTVDGEGAELIDGVANYILQNLYDSVTLQCTGTGWIILNKKNRIGNLHIIPGEDRSGNFILNGGKADTWTDVDFGAYVPDGVKALQLYARSRLDGNGADDVAALRLRKNGSTETDNEKLLYCEIEYTNLGAAVFIRSGSVVDVLCDTDGIIEYEMSDTDAAGYINIYGYYI